MTDDIFEKNDPELAETETSDNSHKSLVDRGRILLEEFRKSGIDENDYLAVDDFLQHYTVDDIKAFYTAKENLERVLRKWGKFSISRPSARSLSFI
jgi:hypothetical protein